MAIEEVFYQENFDSHSNEDRTIIALTKGEEAFAYENTRVVKFERDTELGNHWREYPELYGVIGNAFFTLEDIETKERKSYELKTGGRLFVPPKVALKISAKKGTIIINCSPKVDREGQTHKYQID